ncbi:hypothetical protein [Bacillus sp. JJ722]|uniref:hypothetical protein n=1 Tax=Bacillus sp. JJ722 TaxID=3122973 RepID=UPI002FFDC52D
MSRIYLYKRYNAKKEQRDKVIKEHEGARDYSKMRGGVTNGETIKRKAVRSYPVLGAT